MKFLFIVQGEGRGHMTQAQVLRDVLEKQGHSIVAVILGSSNRRKAPSYFLEDFQCPIYRYPSPNFITDKANKSIKLGATIIENLKKSPRFIRSLKQMDEQIRFYQPDGIVNFYDILGGIYNFIYKPKAKFIAIGHQYLIYHPDFTFAKRGNVNRFLFKLNTKITCHHADIKIALSLWQSSKNSPDTKLKVWPPLVKKVIKNAQVSKGDFYLAYVVNPGYAQELIQSAKENPQSKIEAFWDNTGVRDGFKALPNLTFHQIDEKLFIEKMVACKGFLTTAGFESIGEAMFLGKPSLMVPVKGQYEQQCNALDAEKAGAGKANKTFDLGVLDKYMESAQQNQKGENFKAWQSSLEALALDMLNEIFYNKKEKVY
tara:strand:- start:5079 stop:6194 length:1116 start_codon:yes stop_codon:yes gene_type:complete